MANYILWNKEILLRASSGQIESMHELLEEIVQDENITNAAILDFLTKTNILEYGLTYYDFEREYSWKPEDINLLAELISEIILKARKTNLYTKWGEEQLIQFRSKLLTKLQESKI